MMDILTIALSGLFGLSALVLAAHFTLKAWSGWLDLKKMELANGSRPMRDEPVGGGSELIELADLKARVRKLEAIASGIDL
ncbi:hypothetical protein [Sphingomonas sp. LHG3406-1]|uniref:hypothetical protein n=1 Tax=Sphingomonas sp. LHG3406-1 TaxID=2804617 RepID=UPI0026050DB9|nr:hypothetical protein [Sphingomonas sp. LHG3406-1]